MTRDLFNLRTGNETVLMHGDVEIRIETFDSLNGWTANYQVADGTVHPLGDARFETSEEAAAEALARAIRAIGD